MYSDNCTYMILNDKIIPSMITYSAVSMLAIPFIFIKSGLIRKTRFIVCRYYYYYQSHHCRR